MMQQLSSILNVTIFVMLISFITSCSDDNELISNDYLPIEVGNFWTFINPAYPRDSAGSISIVGTTRLSNGNPVFTAITSDNDKG